jgi:phosphatidylglycerol:prolipoprotein diacylglycerol transferase
MSLQDYAVINIGPVSLHFYGLMYAVGAIIAFFITRWYARKTKAPLNDEEITNIIFWAMIGGVIGGRIFYTLVYNFEYYFNNPLQILAVWQGGMAIHGGFIGGGLALWLVCRWMKKSFWQVADAFAPGLAFGLAMGRIGNFVNGELVGRVTDVPWGMDFGDGENRHPSQLYAVIKDIALSGFLALVGSRVPFAPGVITGLFFQTYGIFRFAVEYFRQPDPQLGFLAFGFTMGQWLSIGLIIVGSGIVKYCLRADMKSRSKPNRTDTTKKRHR